MISCEEVDEDSEAEMDEEDCELDKSDESCLSDSRFRFGAVFEREIFAVWTARLGTDEEVCIGGCGDGAACGSSGDGGIG